MKLPQNLSADDLTLVKEFMAQLRANRLSEDSVENYLLAIRCLAKYHQNKPFKELEKKDMVEWCNYLNSNGYSEGTITLYKQLVRKFIKWAYTGKLDGEKYPKCVSWIKLGRRRPKFPKQILTVEEVKAMMDACMTQRDRAMVSVGYESGSRAGELLGLNIGDVEFDQYGGVIKVSGKTGFRRIRLVLSVNELKLWLSMHPRKDDQKSPIWWSRNCGRLIYDTWYANLRRIARNAGIKKLVTPHLLRHTRATHLAAGVLTEAQMREFFGWTKSSGMPEVYVHLSGRDVDASLLKHYGITVEAEEPEKLLSPKMCPYCGNENSASARFCGRCNSPLDPGSVEEAKKKQKLQEELVSTVIQKLIQENPALVENVMKEFQKELAGAKSG